MSLSKTDNPIKHHLLIFSFSGLFLKYNDVFSLQVPPYWLLQVITFVLRLTPTGVFITQCNPERNMICHSIWFDLVNVNVEIALIISE